MQPGKFGRYKILSELGRGAMGQVYLAHDPEIDRQVAIKTVSIFGALPEHERDEARDRFLREARSAGRLLHPGIVTLFDVGEADGALYLAMEYVEGDTLDHYCRPDLLLPPPLVVEMVSAAAEALAYAHEAGIVHRDVKPANLMRVGEAGVKITDFGLAKPAEAQLTQDGSLLGTPSYMSPEQIRGEALDGRSDLFSLGVVLFELLTGERPFPGDSISSIIYRIVNEEPSEATKVSDAVPAPLGAFLRKALAKEPDARFADGNAFAGALRQAGDGVASLRGGGAAVSSEPVTEEQIPSAAKTRPARSSVLPWVMSIVVLLVALGAAGWYYRDELGLFPSGPPPVTWLETQVRAEPAGSSLVVDGVPLDPQSGGLVRFRPDQPPVRVAASFECRSAERELLPSDAQSEVVLVLDPVRLDWPLETGVESAVVQLNGEPLAEGAEQLELDLCRGNALHVEAAGFHPLDLEIPAGATPLEARRLLAGIDLREIPRGLMVLPERQVRLVFYVDGERVEKGVTELELAEGEHRLRAKNETLWIDVTATFEVIGAETVTPDLRLPAMANLVVQAFPANCKVFLRRPGGEWKYVDDTPARRKLAAGRYDVRVRLNPTGETRDRSVDLGPGDNPPVRVAFGRNS